MDYKPYNNRNSSVYNYPGNQDSSIENSYKNNIQKPLNDYQNERKSENGIRYTNSIVNLARSNSKSFIRSVSNVNIQNSKYDAFKPPSKAISSILNDNRQNEPIKNSNYPDESKNDYYKKNDYFNNNIANVSNTNTSVNTNTNTYNSKNHSNGNTNSDYFDNVSMSSKNNAFSEDYNKTVSKIIDLNPVVQIPQNAQYVQNQSNHYKNESYTPLNDEKNKHNIIYNYDFINTYENPQYTTTTHNQSNNTNYRSISPFISKSELNKNMSKIESNKNNESYTGYRDYRKPTDTYQQITYNNDVNKKNKNYINITNNETVVNNFNFANSVVPTDNSNINQQVNFIKPYESSYQTREVQRKYSIITPSILSQNNLPVHTMTLSDEKVDANDLSYNSKDRQNYSNYAPKYSQVMTSHVEPFKNENLPNISVPIENNKISNKAYELHRETSDMNSKKGSTFKTNNSMSSNNINQIKNNEIGPIANNQENPVINNNFVYRSSKSIGKNNTLNNNLRDVNIRGNNEGNNLIYNKSSLRSSSITTNNLDFRADTRSPNLSQIQFDNQSCNDSNSNYCSTKNVLSNNNSNYKTSTYVPSNRQNNQNTFSGRALFSGRNSTSNAYQNNNLNSDMNQNSLKRGLTEEIIINLEDLLMIEEKLYDIVNTLGKCESCYHECFDWWNLYANCSLSGCFENYFKDEINKQIVREYNFMEMIGICISYDSSFDKDYYQSINYILKGIVKLFHENFLILCDYFLSKISVDSQENNWVKKLEELINGNLKLKYLNNKHIKELKENNKCISDCLKVILKKYPNDNISDPLTAFMNNLSKVSFSTLNDFFRGKIIRIENKKASNLASCLIDVGENVQNKISAPYIKDAHEKEYCLVLDLDETLIHFRVDAKDESSGLLRLRPGIYKFLDAVSPYYEIIVFTAATSDYADPILDAIEVKKKYFSYVFYREHTVVVEEDFVKDISRIGRDLSKMIIVDNMPQNFRLQKENGILIKTFYGEDQNDKALIELIPILIEIAKSPGKDIRDLLALYKDDILKKVSSNISRK